MKLIDKQGRLFGKVSVIDLVVILVVVVLAVSLYLKRNVMEHTSTNVSGTPITYEVKAVSVRDESLDDFQVGDLVYDQDNDSGNAIGTIEAVRYVDNTPLASDTAGNFHKLPVEGRHDVVLTLSALSTSSNGKIYVNRTYELNANSTRNLYTKYVSFECVLTEIHA